MMTIAASDGLKLFIPQVYDIVWSLIILVIVALFFYKFFMPKFNAIFDERAAKIEGNIAKAEQAQKDMESILDSTYAHGEKLDAVLSPYDGISQGIINAIESKRPDMKPGTETWPFITGQDAMELAVTNISADKQGETVFKDVNKLADAVYEMIVEIAEGK